MQCSTTTHAALPHDPVVIPVVYDALTLHYGSHLGQKCVVVSLDQGQPVLLHHILLKPLMQVQVSLGGPVVHVRLCNGNLNNYDTS